MNENALISIGNSAKFNENMTDKNISKGSENGKEYFASLENNKSFRENIYEDNLIFQSRGKSNELGASFSLSDTNTNFDFFSKLNKSLFKPFIQKSPNLKPNEFYPEGSPIISLTHNIIDTYKKCNKKFQYKLNFNPRRVLTKPSIPKFNNGYDNESHDFILYVNTILGSKEGQRYLVIDLLGQGTFGQVVRCQNLKTREYFAVKVIKGKQSYFNQSMMEVTILELLNQHFDPHDNRHIIRIYDSFIHHNHLCLVFELLSVSLYDLLKQNKFRGLSPNLIRIFAKQILEGLCLIGKASIIHADLKPENILLKDLDSPELKIIDFGSACHENKPIFTYIQSRFYRSPEVILGLPYSASIDMWSVGCIIAELFLGLPIFPGTSEYNQISRIVEVLGNPPTYMLDFGKNSPEYFNKVGSSKDAKQYELKSLEQYSREQNRKEYPSKRYFPLMSIPELIRTYPVHKQNITQEELFRENEVRLKFTDFVMGFLNLNPIERWSPQQALLHPFITGEPYSGRFQPPSIHESLPLGIDALSIPANSHYHLASFDTMDHTKGLSHNLPLGYMNKDVDIDNHNHNQNYQDNNSLISKSNKGRGRTRASTVSSRTVGNVPFQIQQASVVAGYYPSSASPKNSMLVGQLKSQKRLSMPNPNLKSIYSNIIEEKDHSELENEVSLMEAGFSKFSLNASANNSRPGSGSSPLISSPLSPPKNRSNYSTVSPNISSPTRIGGLSNNSPSRFSPSNNKDRLNNFLPNEKSSERQRYVYNSSNRYIPAGDTNNVNYPPYNALPYHQKSLSNQYELPQAHSQSFGEQFKQNALNKTRRTYSHGWETTLQHLPSHHHVNPHFNYPHLNANYIHTSGQPPQPPLNPASQMRPNGFYQTRSASYTSPKTYSMELLEHQRTHSMDSNTQPWRSNPLVPTNDSNSSTIRGNSHRPAYLNGSYRKDAEGNSPTFNVRRNTMGSSSNGPSG